MLRRILIAAIVVCAVVLAGCLGFIIRQEVSAGNTNQTEPTVTTTPVTTAPPETTVPPETTLPETEPLETEPQPETFTLTFVGDCTLGTMPNWVNYAYNFVKIIGEDYEKPFQYVKTYFENDDCTFVNLEGVLADEGTPVEKQFNFRGPTSYVNILTMSSVELVTLANNHTYDFGTDGYTSTKTTLDGAGVAYVEKNSSTLITTDSGLTIGVYAVYFSLNKSDLAAEVAQLKENGAEIIVAAVHWGQEGVYTPNNNQKTIAHNLIDAGVDIVWGHHPHVLQPIEEYNGGIIYYSLGNFCFGGNHNPADKDTAVLQQQIIRDVDGTVSLGSLTIVPCSVSSITSRNDFQPTPYEEGSEKYDRVLSKLDGSFDGPNLDMSYRDNNNNNNSTTETTAPTETTVPEESTAPEETTPTETTPEETAPTESQPEETTPAETEPAETEPVETQPVETQPVETAPAQTESPEG